LELIGLCEGEDFKGVVATDADDLSGGICTEIAEFRPEERAKTVWFLGLDKENRLFFERKSVLHLLIAMVNI
jgi:hypothetical protein